MEYLYVIFYIIFAVMGSTLLKLGSSSKVATLFTIPFVNMNISWITFIGFTSYGLSFLLYTVLLSKFDLSFVSPLTVGCVYVLLMITAFIIFKEPITALKIIASILILIGLILMVIQK